MTGSVHTGGALGSPRPAKATNTIRGTVSEDMSGVGSFLYNTGMSLFDSLTAMPMGNFGMVLLGGSAATNAMQSAAARGATDNQALLVGLVADATETMLEKVSIESLFSLKTPGAARSFVYNVLKQAGVEGTEEGLTTIVNTIADGLIMRDKSELETIKRQLMASGMNREEAELFAIRRWIRDFALDVAGGMLSGTASGTVKSGADYIGTNPRQQNNTAPGKKAGANTMLSENDLPEYLTVGEREHVRNLKNSQILSGDSPILTSISAVKRFVQESLSGKVRNTIKAYGRVGSSMANDILVKSNGVIDVSGYYLELDANRLFHLDDHVQDDGDPRNIPLTLEQAQNITEYIDSYDDVLAATAKKDGGKRIILGKRINGHSVIVVLASKGRRSVQPVTAWVNDTDHYREKYGKGGARTTSQQRETLQISGYKHAPHILNVPQVSSTVNGKNVSGAGSVNVGQSNGTDEGIYSEYIRQVREAQEKVHLEAAELWQKVEELKQEYRRNMERLEEEEREAELEAAFLEGWNAMDE